MKKWIKWKHNGKEMWCFGEEEGKYCIGLDAHATILVDKDDVIFLEQYFLLFILRVVARFFYVLQHPYMIKLERPEGLIIYYVRK